MKILNFSILMMLSFVMQAQDKSEQINLIKAQLDELETKISAYRTALGNESINSDEIFELNYTLQEPISAISDIAYEMGNNELTEDIEEAVESVVDDWMGDDGEVSEEKEYKGDLKPKLKQKVKKTLNDFSFVLGWGVNGIISDNTSIKYTPWGSSNWEIGFSGKKQLGKTKSRIVYGLTLNTHYFNLDGVDINASNEDPSYIITESTDFDENRFGVRYLQIPLGLGIKIGRKGEVYFGGHAGFRTKGYTKKEFKGPAGEDVISEATHNYGLQNFNYGADFAIGSLNYKLFAKYDVNQLFAKGNENNNIFTVGLRYGY